MLKKSKDKFMQGVAAFQSGRVAEAERALDYVVQRNPRHFDTLHLLGIIACEAGRAERGVEFFRKAIAVNAGVADAHYNLANALLMALNRPQEALGSYDNAIALRPDFSEAHNNRGIALKRLRRPAEALASYDKAIASKPDYVEAYNNRGNALLALKRPAEALADFDKAISLRPSYADAHSNRSDALVALERFSEALESCDKALALKPDDADACSNRGSALRGLGRLAEGLSSYDKAVSLKADLDEAWLGRGNALCELERFDEALASYDRALALKPYLENSWLGRGNALCELKRFDGALAAYDKALALNPDLESAWLGRGNAFANLNSDNEALACFDKAIALKHDLAEGYLNKGLLKLSLGEYEQGWPLYEWRFKTKKSRSLARNFVQPLWLGDADIANRTILIHSEQGFGDTIQFLRYLPKLSALGCDIVFEAQAPLVPLLEAQKGHFQIIRQGETLPPFDFHCPLLSLPLAFKTTLATIPASAPYLFPSMEKVECWRARLGEKTRSRIGLAWSGNPKFGNDIRRSIALEQILPLVSSEAEWHSVQKDLRESDRGTLESNLAVIDHASALADFSDTAALIAELDLLISVDTAVAHLAGALGKPVWILLPFHPDFRWLRDREDGPWYPTARLFRQSRDGEWGDVLEKVASELKRTL